MAANGLTSGNYKKRGYQEMTPYDVERTLRENVYELDQENIRIDKMVTEMLNQKIDPSLIIRWLYQLENNAAEIVYMNRLTQSEISDYNFNQATIYKGRG